jgi:hypothetical protein
VVAVVLTVASAGTAATQVVNPYAGIDWENVRTLHSFSHQHGSDPRVFWNMGFGLQFPAYQQLCTMKCVERTGARVRYRCRWKRWEVGDYR